MKDSGGDGDFRVVGYVTYTGGYGFFRGVGCVKGNVGDGDVRGVGRAKDTDSSVRCCSECCCVDLELSVDWREGTVCLV